jgi:hypothetical protein
VGEGKGWRPEHAPEGFPLRDAFVFCRRRCMGRTVDDASVEYDPTPVAAGVTAEALHAMPTATSAMAVPHALRVALAADGSESLAATSSASGPPSLTETVPFRSTTASTTGGHILDRGKGGLPH